MRITACSLNAYLGSPDRRQVPGCAGLGRRCTNAACMSIARWIGRMLGIVLRVAGIRRWAPFIVRRSRPPRIIPPVPRAAHSRSCCRCGRGKCRCRPWRWPGNISAQCCPPRARMAWSRTAPRSFAAHCTGRSSGPATRSRSGSRDGFGIADQHHDLLGVGAPAHQSRRLKAQMRSSRTSPASPAVWSFWAPRAPNDLGMVGERAAERVLG
jgi:hypothetical protein